MESTMEPEENQISVWICREEKLVLGLSRRTTCADIVHVLLEEQNSVSAAKSFCIVEKHGGFERVLPNKTKILRLWRAWGDEQRRVKFVLVKRDASLDSHGARSAEARVVRSEHTVTCGTSRPDVGGTSPVGGDISPEKQRRVVRKAFRKLEKMKRKKKRARAERMETLVHLVISQDHTLRQQLQRITHLDVEIHAREAKVHVDRVKRHGMNYVQETYLETNNALPEPEGEKSLSDAVAKLDAHARQCAEALRLEEELWEQEALMETMSARIQEELHLRWRLRRRQEEEEEEEERAFCSGARSSHQNQLFLEKERLKTQLDASSYIWLRLSADLEAIRVELDLSQQMCAAREQEMRDLLEEVNSLDMEDTCGTGDKTGPVWMEQDRGLSKDHSVHDDDSDTGLSSLHSQDSDLPVWESLV